MKFTKTILFLLLCPVVLFGQGEIDEQSKVLYRDEQTIAGYLNSNGFGVGYRYAKNLNAFRKLIYDVDLVNIRHTKENKTPSPIYPNGRSFVYGKRNNFFNLKGGIGLQQEAFRKFDRGGIAIRHFYSIGPAIGLLKPIYYEFYSLTTDPPQRTVEKFPADANHPTILGRASFFRGFDELQFVPGGFLKAGVSFEFSELDEVVHALETGAAIDLFYKKVPIMAGTNNNFFFFTMYISYRFGKVIDKGGRSSTNELDQLILD